MAATKLAKGAIGSLAAIALSLPRSEEGSMAGACAFDVDENVAARSSNGARPRREVAATLQPASADLGTKAGVARVERPVPPL